ncbi:porin family protein [Bradyrhizobium manausense]|uniref:outer membrane protein n=1 Tax=Bradyrhizobium TaxID=374 RepID=UPI001BA91BDD|nr:MULTISPECIES: outer membrane beta-barrel protein [Bradyrhizobium]MBR0827012.1 porin family protein [Bradyrhizobium manausense]UVO32292.1 outer membrane beta-barrel protein [Bradyrhizobium arachidis]
MNKTLLSGVIALAISTLTPAVLAPALAADVPLPYKAAPAAAPAYSWTGCYVGGNGGGGRGLNEWQPLQGIEFNSVHNSGWFAGVQAGCDYQVGSLVVGIEGQFDWADMKDTTATVPAGVGGVGFLLTSKLDRFATATARVGYAFDRVLLYAKGGAAFAHFDQNFTQTDFLGTTIPMNGTQNIAGFVVGGGLEYALLPNVSLKAEYNYFDFGRNGVLISCAACIGGAAATLPFEIKQSMQTFMLGVNYRFGMGAPLVARY